MLISSDLEAYSGFDVSLLLNVSIFIIYYGS